MAVRLLASRRVVPLLVLSLLAAASSLVPPAGPAAALPVAPPAAVDGAEPVVSSPSPVPGALVAAGSTHVRAHLRPSVPGEIAPARVRVTVDGEPLAGASLHPRAGGQGVEVTAVVDLAPGEHVVEVAFTDAAGREGARAWSFTSTSRVSRRFSGPTRIETAVALSSEAFAAPGSTGAPGAAVLARADDFADALAGVPLAAAVGGPLLLSSRDGLPAATATELRRVLAAGSTVHLLGGTAALGEGVRRDVEALGLRTVRHGGADRFETAAAVAAALPASPGAILASGTSFPDALAASVPAARDGLPVLLTAAGRLPEATASAIAAGGASTVTIVGGTAVVGPGVEAQVAALAREVRRIAGPDRFETAAAVLEAFWDRPLGASLASGATFPDALAGARHAAALDQPLLLTNPATLAGATSEALRRHQPEQLHVYGGTAAIGDAVARAAVRAAQDGPDAPRVRSTQPADRETVASVEAVTVEFDRAVQAGTASVHVEIAGAELHGRTEQAGPATLVFRPLAGQPAPEIDVRHPVVVTARAHDAGGRAAHHEAAFTYLEPDPVFATAGPVSLHLPSRDVELVGFHQALHRGAQQQHPRDTATPKTTLPSRQRGTGLRTAADVVAAPDSAVLAPVSGVVLRAGSYVLYCDYQDQFVVIAPDARPDWEVKMLHFHGLRVARGDRVVAGQTAVGAGPRVLPFRSQVDADTQPRNWPHLHVEVVDPSIPTGPGRGC